jgi:hypothetical protein
MQPLEAKDRFDNPIRPGTLLGINYRYLVGAYVVEMVKVWQQGEDQGQPYVYGRWPGSDTPTMIRYPQRGVVLHPDHVSPELRALQQEILAALPAEGTSVYDPEDE